MTSPLISFCVPVHNEEQILLSYLKKIQKGLINTVGKDNFEILIIENGSTDNTVKILKRIKEKNVRIFYANKKGHGIAYGMGIAAAKGDFIVLSAIDIPFGFTDITNARSYWKEYDILFGSKAHPQSIVYVSWKRKMTSFCYQALLKILFHTNIGDTQGSIIIKRTVAKKLLPYCTAENAFFTAELAIYGRYFGYKLKEIPVIHDKVNVTIRKSKYNIMKDGKIMFQSMVNEYTKIKNLKTKDLLIRSNT